jgi:hypothetical protein
MDENALTVLYRELSEGRVTAALPYLIDMTLEFDRDIPGRIAEVLDGTGKDWRYYNTMIYYAIRWFQLGSSPSKLKKLMDEAIHEMTGPEAASGKRSASKMFMDYLHYKKTIDEHLKQKLRVK